MCLQCRRQGFSPWAEKISWRREWQSTPIFLSEKSHGQRSLGDYSPWGPKESDATKHAHILIIDRYMLFIGFLVLSYS